MITAMLLYRIVPILRYRFQITSWRVGKQQQDYSLMLAEDIRTHTGVLLSASSSVWSRTLQKIFAAVITPKALIFFSFVLINVFINTDETTLRSVFSMSKAVICSTPDRDKQRTETNRTWERTLQEISGQACTASSNKISANHGIFMMERKQKHLPFNSHCSEHW